MHVGNYLLVLHSHLPYVLHHGDWPHGTDWLCEAVAESYVPLLNVFHELLDEGVRPAVTIGLSPVLCEQLEHKDFADLFTAYCDSRVEAAREDARHFAQSEEEQSMQPLAKFWEIWYSQRKKEFQERYNSSVVGAFKSLQDNGALEVMTCGATHGYYPLLAEDKSVNLQMRASRENYRKHFGRLPRGTWIPECAYRPAYPWQTYLPINRYSGKRMRYGVEQLLHKHELGYFFVDQHAFEDAVPIGKRNDTGTLIPVYSDNFQPTPWNFDRSPMSVYQVSSDEFVEAGTSMAFARHKDVAMQVWSGEMGYPGDPDYLDFHKKYHRSSLRYWRVTDNQADMQYKQHYVPQWTSNKVDLNAHHFIKTLEASLLHYHSESGKKGNLCTMFDTELFGHWWFEGPAFVKAVLKGLHSSPLVQAVTASECIEQAPPKEVMAIPESSWGDGGQHEVWMSEDTKWMWYAIYQAEAQFDDFLQLHPPAGLGALSRRILNQALRELMLMQASDWEFLISTMSAKDYAERRFQYHYSDFCRLLQMAELCVANGSIPSVDEHFLQETERRNYLFEELRLEWWS